MEYLLGKAQHTSLAPAEQDELRRYVQVAQPGAKDVTFETIVTLGLIQSSVRTCCIRISNLRRPPAPGTAPECCPLLRRVLCRYLCTGGLPVRPPGLRGPPGYPIVRAGYVQRGSLCRSPAAGRVFFPPYAAGDAILVAGVAAGGIRAAMVFPAYEARIPHQPQIIRSILNRGRISRVNLSWLTGGVRDAAGAGDPGPNPRSVGRRELHRTAALKRILFGMFLSGGRSHYARF